MERESPRKTWAASSSHTAPTKTSGTGLGLLIVRRIIREHGGEIEIQSQPNEGTNILIHLPHTAPSPRLLPSPTIDA